MHNGTIAALKSLEISTIWRGK